MQFTIRDKQFLGYLSILVSLYILPIMLADFYYADDLARSIWGYDWIENGRLIATFLYNLLNFGNSILDISPLTQILAGFCLVLSGFIIYKYLFYGFKPFIASLTAFLFIANPFFLQNISYKYDSFLMGFSILLACLAFILIKKNTVKSLCFSLILLVCLLLTYQPAISIFIGLCILSFLQNYQREANSKKVLLSLVQIAGITIIAYIIYHFISKPFITGWIASYNSMISLNSNGLLQLWVNIKNSFNFIAVFFKDKITLYLFLLPFIISCIYNIYLSFKKFKIDKKDVYSILSFILACSSPIFLYFIMLIPIIPLENPLYVPRVFIGFSLLLLFSFLGFIQFLDKTKWKYPIIFPVLYCMVLSYSYSNASKAQKNFDINLIDYVAQDLINTNNINNIQYILLEGTKPITPTVKLIIKKYPFLYKNKILREYFDIARGYHTLKHYPMLNNIKEVYNSNSPEVQSKMLEFNKIKAVKSNPIYSMKILGDTALIEYKEQ